jgi:hypothetical protein
MTRQKFIDVLTVKLTKAMRPVMDELADDADALDVIGWQGNELDRLMAKAAAAVVESSIDVQEYLQKEGMMRDPSEVA